MKEGTNESTYEGTLLRTFAPSYVPETYEEHHILPTIEWWTEME